MEDTSHGYRPQGTGRALTPEQERDVQHLIRDHVPDQLKTKYALWTCSAVRELILRRYDVLRAVRVVGNYLNRWGFTPQKPLKKAYEQSPQAVGIWLNEEYGAISKRAKQESAEIHWAMKPACVRTMCAGAAMRRKGRLRCCGSGAIAPARA